MPISKLGQRIGIPSPTDQQTRLLHRREALHALARAHFGRVKVAASVDREVVEPVELAGLAAEAPERGDALPGLAHHDVDLTVRAVRDEEMRLQRVGREDQIVHRAVDLRFRLDRVLANEGAVLAEHLDAVVGAVADVDQTIDRESHAMHRVRELRRVRGVVRKLAVVRPLAIRAPVALVRPRRRVEHDDALVLVPVRDVDLVDGRIDLHVRGPSELVGRIAAARGTGLADLQQELAFLGELEDVLVLHPVRADPDVARGIDVDPVLVLRPVVPRTRPAPSAEHVPLGIEHEHRRRGHAAFRARRIGRRSLLVVDERAGAVDNPDTPLAVNRNAGDLAPDPLIGQRLRPRRIDRVPRRRAGLTAWLGLRAAARQGDGRCEGHYRNRACSHRMLPRSQSSFAPLSLTTLAHLTRSASMNSRNSSGELPTGSEPSATIRSRTSGWLRILTNSSCRRATIGFGRLAGPITPYQPTTSNPGNASATAGMSGIAARRVGVVTAIARSFPARTWTCAPWRPAKLN